jgi:threonine/homoserine/homoserine lactone efflux protein
MFGIHDLPIFLAAALLLVLTPGPDTALVLGQGLRNGARGGVLAAFGVAAGCCVHVSAAAIGISALLLASAAAFNAIKWLGVCYLAFLGLRMLLTAGRHAAATPQSESATGQGVFWQGFLSNVLNPKVALFFLAFLPQFIDPSSPNKALGFALLGLIFTATGTVWLTAVALTASRSAARLRGKSSAAAWLERMVGAALLAIATRLAFADR